MFHIFLSLTLSPPPRQGGFLPEKLSGEGISTSSPPSSTSLPPTWPSQQRRYPGHKSLHRGWMKVLIMVILRAQPDNTSGTDKGNSNLRPSLLGNLIPRHPRIVRGIYDHKFYPRRLLVGAQDYVYLIHGHSTARNSPLTVNFIIN